MKAKLTFMLLVLLLIGGCQQLFAKSQLANNSPQQWMLQENILCKFKVKGQKVVSISKGRPEECPGVRKCVNYAMRAIKISYEKLEYQVQVKKMVTGIKMKYNSEQLVIYEYRLDVPTNVTNRVLNKFIDNLATNDETFGKLLNYEYPTSCHYLVDHGQLVLFVYNGFPEHYQNFDPRILIKELYG